MAKKATPGRRTQTQLLADLRAQEARQAKRAELTKARIRVLDARDNLNKLMGK